MTATIETTIGVDEFHSLGNPADNLLVNPSNEGPAVWWGLSYKTKQKHLSFVIGHFSFVIFLCAPLCLRVSVVI
jgi:hypothetical protein